MRTDHQHLGRCGIAFYAVIILLGSSVAGAIAEDAWPMWRRDTKGGPIAGEPSLQDPQITEETRLWISEADIPPGRRGSGDDGRGQDGLEDMERPITGGFSSPIAADGKIFHYFYRPTGSVYDLDRARALGITTQGVPIPDKVEEIKKEIPSLDDALDGGGGGLMDMDDLLGPAPADKPEKKKETPPPPPKIEGNLVRGNERWLVAAANILVAIDQETGKTVWQTELTDKGLNFGFFGKGASGITPVYHDGMVMAFGTSAQVFGVDAKTGELRWTYNVEPRHERHMQYLRDALEGKSSAARFNRDMLGSLVAADGIVVINDQRWYRVSRTGGTDYHYDTQNSYVALDVQTGEELWAVPEVGSSGTTPKLLKIDGKTYVLAIRSNHLTLLDLKTGEQLWQSALGHSSPTCAFNLGVSDKYVIMAAGGEGQDGRELSGFAVDLDGLHQLWTWGPISEFRSNVLIVDETAYMHVDGHLRSFSAATGETISEVYIGDIRPAGGNPFIAYYGGWIFSRGRGVGEDGEDGIFAFKADPQKMAESKRFFAVDTAQPYFVLIFPAFANSRIFFRTDYSFKMEAYQLQ